ncbi:MAG: 4-hydroxy-tetrahydrodipicolinate synthase [Armatimonadota bacterium]
MKLTGTWTALTTPFRDDLAIDWEALEKNVEFQISEGIDGLLPVGTTGESPTLDYAEHSEVIDKVTKQINKRCGVLAGTGSNSTAETLEMTEHAVESGVDAVLMVDCYYNGPSSQELRDCYYAPVAEMYPDITIVPYVIPGRTGTVLLPEDLAILYSKFPNINTVKEATGDLERMAKTRNIAGSDFSIMSGDDDMTFDMLKRDDIKANGVISVATNVVPGAVSKMVNSALAGDFESAANMREALSPLFGIVTVKVDNERILPDGSKVMVNDRYRNPLPYKTLMAGLGMPVGGCRHPLGMMTAAGVEVVRNAAKKVWQNNPEILAPIEKFYGVDIEARLNDDSVWESLTY